MDIKSAIEHLLDQESQRQEDYHGIVGNLLRSHLQFSEAYLLDYESLHIPAKIGSWHRAFLKVTLENIVGARKDDTDRQSAVFAFTQIASYLLPRRAGPSFLSVLHGYTVWLAFRDSIPSGDGKSFDRLFKKMLPKAKTMFRDAVHSVAADIERAWQNGDIDSLIRAINYLHCLLNIPRTALDGPVIDSVVGVLRKISHVEASFFASLEVEKNKYLEILNRAIEVLSGMQLHTQDDEDSIRWQSLIYSDLDSALVGSGLKQHFAERSTVSGWRMRSLSNLTSEKHTIGERVDRMRRLVAAKQLGPKLPNSIDRSQGVP
jgi:hypothetical protein